MLFSGQDIKPRGGMAAIDRGLGRGVSFALFGDDMDQDRSRCTVFHRAQNGQQLVHIVAVDWPNIGKAQSFEQGTADGHAL